MMIKTQRGKIKGVLPDKDQEQRLKEGNKKPEEKLPIKQPADKK